jgi:hypothetical protein
LYYVADIDFQQFLSEGHLIMDMYDELNADRAAIEIQKQLDIEEINNSKAANEIDLFRGYVQSITKSDVNYTNFKNYIPQIVNRSLSFSPDMVMQADEMNKRPYLSKELQFQFLRHTVEKKYRDNKWVKKTTNDRIKLVMKVYKYSYDKAKSVLGLLSNDQFLALEESQNKGGICDDKRL